MRKRTARMQHFLQFEMLSKQFNAVLISAIDLTFLHSSATFISTFAILLKVCHLQIRQLEAECESSHLVLYIKHFHLDRCGGELKPPLQKKRVNHPHAYLSALIQLNYNHGVYFCRFRNPINQLHIIKVFVY